MKKRALISVSDKTGIVEFAKGLWDLGYEILSTGGTQSYLEENGVACVSVSDVTGFPEMLDGRVKTLHPLVHGALLGKRDNDDHVAQMQEHGIRWIDMVCVNLYPFKQTLQKTGVTQEEIIENIDIGGPSMLRSAAKNFASVTVVCDPKDYEAVLFTMKEHGEVNAEMRQALAAKVFRHTANYDATIAKYMTNQTGLDYPEFLTLTYEKVADLRYGENPHQNAAFYKGEDASYSLVNAKQLHGKKMSYNNLQDANAALLILKEFEEAAVVALKHMNPCGVGSARTIGAAWEKAYEGDRVSIFGGIVACNRKLDTRTAKEMAELFLEIVIAPSYEPEALEILFKKKNLRVFELDTSFPFSDRPMITNLLDGILVQQVDTQLYLESDLKCVTEKQVTASDLEELIFAWKIVKHVKSNAIVLSKDHMTVGIGAGQMNRVGSAAIAIEQAGDKAEGSYLASDAFFPMSDTVDMAAKAGVKAIIQPGGSIRDQESIDLCNRKGIAMVFTGMRHFKH